MKEEHERPVVDIPEVLAQALFDQYESWDKDMKIWPSDLGIALGPEFGGCPVQFYHKCRNAPQKHPSPGQILMYKMGDLAEEYLIDLLRKYLPRHGWVVVGAQERCVANGISGRSDVRIQHVATGHTVVIDVKTKRGNAFQYLNEPKEGNVLQVQQYLMDEENPADEGGLLYADREGQNFVRYFDVPREDERPAKAVSILESIRDADEPPPPVSLKINRRKNKGPDSIYLNKPWQMSWCNLKECRCLAALPKSPPDGIVAKVANDGLVTATEGNEQWLPQVLSLLREEYPDEEFSVDGDLYDEVTDD